MSHNNSKSRKSNFSNAPHSNPPPPANLDTLPNYGQTYGTQSVNSNLQGQSIPQMPYFYGNPGFIDPNNLPTGSSNNIQIQTFIPQPPGQQGIQNNAQGYYYPPGMQQPNFQGGNIPEGRMLEEFSNLKPTNDQGSSKRSRKDDKNGNIVFSEDFETVNKQTKLENPGPYHDKLERLGKELEKVKEFEIQVFKSVLSSSSNSHLLSTDEKMEDLQVQKSNLAQNISMPSNLLVQNALANIPHEASRAGLVEFMNIKPKDASEIEQMKKDLIKTMQGKSKQVQGEVMEEEPKEEICKVIQVNMQTFYQENAKLKELEDKAERLEHTLREKRGKLKDISKKVGEAMVEVVIASNKRDIALKRTNGAV